MSENNIMVNNLKYFAALKAANKGLTVVQALSAIGAIAGEYKRGNDWILVDQHIDVAQKAMEDVILAPKYQNVKDLSHIINFVLQGENHTDDKNIAIIGMRIWNEISIKRDDK
jgi:purine nucleoside phosphorylase